MEKQCLTYIIYNHKKNINYQKQEKHDSIDNITIKINNKNVKFLLFMSWSTEFSPITQTKDF